MAIGPSGLIHVSYYDNTSGDLEYAYRDATSWHRQTVDAAGDVGEYTSIALDTLEHPHISYYNYGAQDLKYAAYDGSIWQIQTLDTAGTVGQYTSIALDTADHPHISHFDATNSALKYIHFDGTDWFSETVDNTGYVGLYGSLVLDGADLPRISYVDAQNGLLKYAAYNSTGIGLNQGWQIETVDTAGRVGGNVSLALDGNEWPHLTYADEAHANLRYAWYDAGQWLVDTVDVGLGDIGMPNSLALDGVDLPHVLYYDGANLDLKYAYHDGTVWHIETVVVGGDVGSYNALALDGAGLPHISYYDATNGDLFYGYYDSTTWVTQTVDTSGDVGRYNNLALDAVGLPHISYYDADNQDLLYAHYDGSVWVTQTVDSVGWVGEYSDLALDTAGLPHISFYDTTNHSLRYARYGSTGLGPTQSWHIETVDSAGYVGRYTSIALNSIDLPLISYYDDIADDLKLAHYNGLYWELEVVDEPGNVGQHTALALDAAGRPHIGYNDVGGGNLKYARITCLSVTGAEIEGPATLLPDETGAYTATYLPPTATPPVTLLWDDGTVGSNAAYSWTLPGIYTLTVTATNDCGEGQGTFTVTVCPQVLQVGFDWSPLNPIVGEVVAFYGDAGAALPSTFVWDLGDGTLDMGQQVTHTYAQVGAYTVTMTATNACGEGSSTDVVTVVAPVIDPVAPAPVSLAPGEAAVGSLSIGNSGNYTLNWSLVEAPPVDWLDESPTSGLVPPGESAQVTLTYTAPMDNGVFTTVLSISSNDPFSPQVDIEVRLLVSGCLPLSGTDFGWTPLTPTVGHSVTFTAEVTGSGPVTYSWDLGDGAVGEGAVFAHTYADTGIYTVSLTAANACSEDSITDVVTVVAPVVDPVAPAPVSLAPGEAAVGSLSIGNSGSYTLSWSLVEALPVDWLDESPTSGLVPPGESAQVTLTYTAPMDNGVFTTVLSISSNDPFSPQVGIEVRLLVSGCLSFSGADFGWTPLTPTAGHAVTFTAEVTGSGPITYSWDLGDGAVAEGAVFTHSYADPGTYTVSLTAANACSERRAEHVLTVLQSEQSWEIYLPLVYRGYSP